MHLRAPAPDDSKEFLPKSHFRTVPLKILTFLLLFLILGVGFLLVSLYMTRYFGGDGLISAARVGFQPCVEEPRSLSQWIAPPKNLMHSMTDKELFWRASFTPQVKKYPYKRVPKIAFMFLTKGPLPLYPLWERFLRGHEGLFSIYIHSLPSYQAHFPPNSSFYGRQIQSQVAEWGQMSICDAERRLLANALLDLSNEWFVLLSETCIPLFNFNVIYTYFMRSRYCFIGAFDDPGPYGRGRYNSSMAPEVEISQWRKGSQWFEVNRKVAVSMVKDIKYYLKFKQFCKPHCYVDEHYFPTMLTVEVPHLLANRSLTWVDWSRGGAHPATFGMPDVSETFLRKILEGKSCLYNNQPTTVCFLFARKFAPSALQPLLQLAPTVLGFG